MDDDPLELEYAIKDNIARKAKLVQEIRKLKTENGMKYETFARVQETHNSLAKEAESREKEYEKLEKDVKDRLERRQKTKQIISNRAIENFEDLEEKEKLKETFSYLLDHRINNLVRSHIKTYCTEAYGLEKYPDEEQNAYSKSQHISTILVILEENIPIKKKEERMTTYHSEDSLLTKGVKTQIHQYMTTFRVARQTTVIDFKKKACKFWNKKVENYDFFDEKGELLEDTGKDKKEAKKLERFFKFRKNDLTQMMMIMKSKHTSNTIDLDQSIERDERGIDINDTNQMDTYHNFNKIFPKLKPYFRINRKTTEEKEKNFKEINHPKTFGNNHCCIILIILVIFTVSVLSILVQKEVGAEFHKSTELEKILQAEGYASIYSLEDVFKLIYTLAKYFPYDLSDTTPTSSLVYSVYKPIVFRQYRVKSKSCPINIANFKCYNEIYDSKTRETEDFTFVGSDFSIMPFSFTWKEEEEKFDSKMQGVYGEYDSEAYINTFDPQSTIVVDFVLNMCIMFAKKSEDKENCRLYLLYYGQEWVDKWNLINEAKITYVDQSTKALRITIHLYHDLSKTFILFDPLIEFTPLGTVITSVERTFIYRPNLKEHTDAHQKLLGIVTVIFATFLLIFVLYNVFATGNSNSNGKVNLNYFINLQGVLNLGIIIFAYYSHHVADKLNGYKFSYEALMKTENLNAMNELAHTYELFFIMKSVLIAFTSTRLLLLLRLHTRVETTIKTYEKAIPMSYAVLLTVGPSILALTFFAHFSLGPKEPLFSKYGSALAQILFCVIGLEGTLPNHFNAAEVIIVLVAFFLLYMMILSLFASINVENFRQTMLDYGKSYHKNKNYIWKRRDYITWFIAWVPTHMKQSILNKKKNLEDVKEKISQKLTGKRPPKAKYEEADQN